MYINVFSYIHIYIYIYIYTYTYINSCIYTFIFTHTHTHTHTGVNRTPSEVSHKKPPPRQQVTHLCFPLTGSRRKPLDRSGTHHVPFRGIINRPRDSGGTSDGVCGGNFGGARGVPQGRGAKLGEEGWAVTGVVFTPDPRRGDDNNDTKAMNFRQTMHFSTFLKKKTGAVHRIESKTVRE